MRKNMKSNEVSNTNTRSNNSRVTDSRKSATNNNVTDCRSNSRVTDKNQKNIGFDNSDDIKSE